MNGPLHEQRRGIMVCDKVCLGVMLTSSLHSCDESIFCGWQKSQGGLGQLSYFWRICLQAGRGVIQRKILPAFAIFQGLTAQNNQYTKVAYLGVAFSSLPQNLQTSHYPQTSNYWSDADVSQSCQLHCETWMKFFPFILGRQNLGLYIRMIKTSNSDWPWTGKA